VGSAEPSRDSPDSRCKELRELIAGVLVFFRSGGDSSSTNAANTAASQSWPHDPSVELLACNRFLLRLSAHCEAMTGGCTGGGIKSFF